MIFHENRLPADDSHEISCLICYFWKGDKIWNCCLLQPLGGALRVKSVKAIQNIRELYVIWLPQVILPNALVLKDECFGKNYSSFLDFTRNYEWTSGIFVPCTETICFQEGKIDDKSDFMACLFSFWFLQPAKEIIPRFPVKTKI